MKELAELLEQLASKLGTTVEKLWSVLLKQAPIGGAVDLLICIAMVIFTVWAMRFVNRKTTDPKDGYADWREEDAFFAWLGAGALALISIICIISSAEMMIAAFFNPEYWALSKILSHCK